MNVQETLYHETKRSTARALTCMSRKLVAAFYRNHADDVERAHVNDPKILEFVFPDKK